MSEHWKSTPRYWCKHCSCYVRDTKLERQNHDATAKHQGSLKRFLRDLHRGHEREEREKDRARREVARLNGVVDGSSSSATGSSYRNAQQRVPSAPSDSALKRQREQLAELGVAIPSDFRPEMAMPGEWTVTNTRVIEDNPEAEAEVKIEAKASSVRKREVTEEEREEEEVVRGLFKKPRKWGRDTKNMPQADAELDALLNASTFQPVKPEQSEAKREEDAPVEETKTKAEDGVEIKPEPHVEDETEIKAEAKTEVKTEAKTEDVELPPLAAQADEGTAAAAANPVIFKKRKAKNIRQK